MRALGLSNIARALGGSVSGRNVVAPGPWHSHADRSLSIKIDPVARWQAEAARLNSDWNGLMRLRTSIAPLTCDICGAAPCINPSFCRLCRQTDAKAARTLPDAKIEWRRGLLHNGVSLERAYTELSNRPTPEATVEAVKHAVRDHGLRALSEIQAQERLQRCDADARTRLDRWIENRHST